MSKSAVHNWNVYEQAGILETAMMLFSFCEKIFQYQCLLFAAEE